jgi:hypothetical protein
MIAMRHGCQKWRRIVAKRTPEDVCIEYAIAAEAVRKYTRLMRANPCTEASEGEFITGAPGLGGFVSDCLSEFFAAPKGPGGEFPRYKEFHDLMCDGCKARLDAINLRSAARVHLGAAKRRVEAIGKRLNAEASHGNH